MTLAEINHIFLDAANCQRCYPGEKIYVPLPDPKNSCNAADIMFVLERPGRIGTGKSGHVSFENDDESARFFKECLEATGLDRRNIFITNACLCHPDFEGYRDKRPSLRELTNCHHWLRQQLRIVQPLLIVTVGLPAFNSICRYFAISLPKDKRALKHNVGRLIDNTDPWIYPVFHTSQLGQANRRPALQKSDWLRIPNILERARSELKD